MCTVGIGALCNLILDPIFIFGLNMGIQGAAIATVLSQSVSCLWVLRFLLGKKNLIRLHRANLKPDRRVLGRICGLGVSTFIMNITESAVSAVFNANLQQFGGDLYVTTMTVGTSISQIFFLVIQGFGQGAQPVNGYNYGAGEYGRVRQGFRFLLGVSFGYACLLWAALQLFLPKLITLFNSDAALVATATPMLRIYFLLTFLFSLQTASQNTFVALGEAKRAAFFALFRKVLLLIPLVIALPRLGFGVTGIFAAEPIADTISALVCCTTFLCTCYRELKQKELAQRAGK
jgi:putative MATE family efflux protein